MVDLMESTSDARSTNKGLNRSTETCITNLNDHALFHVHLCKVHMELNEDKEALKIINAVEHRFQGSNQSFAIAKLNSDLCLKQGDVDNALKSFGRISMVRY